MNLLERKGWVVLFQRAQTDVAEIDLIVEKGNLVRLIEVKTLDDSWRSFQRISRRQVQKLLLNQILFSRFEADFQMSCWVAWVAKDRVDFVQVN